MNKVCLIGRLTAEPEVKVIDAKSDLKVGKFTLAQSDGRKDPDGNEHTNYIPVVVFGKTAEVTGEFLHKGSLVGVEGTLSQRSYEREDGTRANVIEVLCSSIDLLDKKEVKKEDKKSSKKA